MRLSINIDAVHYEIDSTDPETLGRWMVEIYGRVKHPTPATLYRIQAWPSTVETDEYPGYKSDWIVNSRWLGQIGYCRTPRELVNQLTKWLDAAESGVLPNE